MSRLAREFQRLYLAPEVLQSAASMPVHAGVRGLVLEVARPAHWQPLSAVWQGAQADLGLPAPAIAANGLDGLQLWFSLAEPVDTEQGLALLEALRQRYLADLPLHRVAMQALASPTATPRAVQPGGPWSAFVAADLAPVFEESPWLDLPPNDEGQADMLSRMASIQPAALAAAWAALHPGPATAPEAKAPTTPPVTSPSPLFTPAAQFLRQVMHDETAPLALRVDAAKALLPYGWLGEPEVPKPAPP